MSADLAQLLLSQVNISILPVILLPVTGLSCLVFYNRLAALNGLIHAIQREIRNALLQKEKTTKREKELLETLYREYSLLVKRSHLIRQGIRCCFIALFLFALSAITVMLGVMWGAAIFVTLSLWTLGALSFAIGIACGFIEMTKPALDSLKFEDNLLTEWMREERSVL